MNTDSIEKQIELKAPVSRVWRALTDYREFNQWFQAKLDSPFTPGKVTRGQSSCSGSEHVDIMLMVEKMEPERFFSYRWHPFSIDSAVDYSKEPTTLVEFQLEAKNGGTVLTVKESGFDALSAERRSQAFPRHEEGWVHQLANIAHHVAPQA